MASKLRTMPATRRRSSSAPRSRAKSAAPRRRKPVRRRTRTALLPSLRNVLARLRPRTPLLGERGREVVALALLACGLYLVFVIYGGWDGGSAGHALTVALGWILGKARVFAPLALLAAGIVLLLGPALGLERPLRAGAICVFAAITLALAAGTLGITSGPGPHSQAWTSAHMQSHGGVVGEALFRLASPLVHGLGVGILVVFLAITGTMLLTGSSLGALVRAGARALAGIARLLHERLFGESAQEADSAFPPAEHAPAPLTHAAGASAAAPLWDDEPEPLPPADTGASAPGDEVEDEPLADAAGR